MACTARSSSAIDRIVRFKTRGGTYFITPPLSLRQARKKQLQGCIRVLFEKAPSLRWEVSNLQTVTLVLPNGPPPPHGPQRGWLGDLVAMTRCTRPCCRAVAEDHNGPNLKSEPRSAEHMKTPHIFRKRVWRLRNLFGSGLRIR